MKKTLLLSLFLMLWFAGLTFSQRISGYYPNYNHTTAFNTNMQYQKMTHLYYFSLNPIRTVAGQSNGALWFNDIYSWFTTASFNAVVAQARAVNPAIKILLVTGGAPGSDTDLNARLLFIAQNAGRLTTFCNNICSFIKANNLDGWDLDWEFPTNATERNAHEAMLARMRQKIDSMKTADCKHYEITIAVGGGYTNCVCYNPCDLQKVNAGIINHVDIVNIMSYDGPISSPWDPSCSNTSHQHYDRYVASHVDWRAAFPTWPNSKLALGVGFYDNPVAQAFRAGGNNNTWYNQNYWGNGGGSGCPNMRSKVDYARAQGTAGVFIWELTQDNLCVGTTTTLPTPCFSLLDCIYQRTIATWGTWVSPAAPCTAPVSLLSFNGNRKGKSVELVWATANELNNNYFSVERSLDGATFNEVGREYGQGTTINVSNYTYLDLNAALFTTYYRLAQVDFDGTVTYTSIVSIEPYGSDISLLLKNNPFDEELSFEAFGATAEEYATLELVDQSGKLIYTKSIQFREEYTLGRSLSPGFYIIELKYLGQSKRYKIIKN